MTLVDSEAAFAARCKEICGDDSLHTLLQASGVRTHSALAFSCGTPKAQPTEAEFKAFADSVVGSPASIGRVSQLKRLHFESSTLVIAQLRALVEGDSTESGKRLPAAEKSARLADAKKRLKGLVIEDEMEPSHALIDAVSHMGESNAVVWIPPSKCTKRDAELKLGLRDKQKYLTVQEQSVTLAPAPDKIVAEHGTPLEVQWCLQRRGLAFFMCGFMEWETHEKWVASLLRCLSSDVPPGYAPISMQQILRADSEIFLLLAREVKRVKPDSSGVMEMDVLMNRFRHDPRITTYLQPLQRGSASQGVASPSLAGEVGSSFPDLRPSKRQKKRDAKLKAPIKTANLPEELKSCPYHADSSGHRFCWQFNLGKCNAECKGSPPACSRGVHGCMTCRRLGHGHSACWFAHAGKGKLQHPPGLVLPCQPMQRLRNPWPVPPQCGATLAHIPAKAQLLRHVPIVQAGGKELVKVDSWEMAWGLPWEPEEFMQKASESCHPRSMGSVLPAPLNDTLESLDKLGDAEVSALRARVIKEWLHLATSLSSNEAELKASMHPDVREITASKRILLWEALLKKYDYPDQCVSSLLKEGVPLVGHDPALAAEVCSKTDKEREAGWIVGPLCESSLCDGILVSRRFGIQQGQKVRCIDNLTSSGVNLAVQAYEAPQPQSTDVVASTCLRLLKSIKKRAGKVLFKILGKAFDLTAAYRQMPVHPDTAWAAYVCFVHPDTNERVYFRMKAMPFGSAMAVYAFLRISHSLWFLGAKALLLPWSSFFDDFVTFATTGCSASAEAAVTSMFKLLGWAFAESGEKANDFSECFQALGIMVDLRACLDGTISFKNTAKRVSEIRAFVGKVLESGRLPHHEALRLRGRCQFADSQISGRTGKKCLGLITAHAYGFDDVISRELRASLEKFLLRLEVGAPRLIKILEGGSWHVYTDASYEPGAGHSFCGLGGVLVDPTGVPRKFFSLVLSDAQKNFLGEQNSAQIIFQAEMLAMAVALDVWLQDLMGHTAIFFVDNNGVRDAAISANARASVARRLLEAFLQKVTLVSHLRQKFLSMAIAHLRRAFTTGAYYHCGTVGVRHNARAYPLASHRDLRNLPGSLNGVDLLVSAGPVTFDATVEHETLDWTNGVTEAPASVPALSHTTTAADELAVLLEVISEHAGATSLVQFTVPCLSTFFTSKTGSWSFAELLVDAVFQLCSHCRAVGVPFAILHPATSRFWHMPSCQHFFQAADGEWTTFDQCMHGGAQDRRAFWWASTAWLRPLQATCSKDHKHYSQAASAPQWPHLLWDRAVELLCQHSGFTPNTSSLFGPPGRDLRPAMGKQSRKARPLVSEFCKYDAWAVPLRAEQPVLQLLRCYPKGARAVRRKLVDPGLVRVCVLPSVDLCKVDDVLSSPWTWATKHCKHDAHTPTKDFSDVCGLLPPTEHSPVLEVVWIGIPREPDDFLRRAVAAGHPKSLLDVEADPHMTLLIDNLLNSNVKQPDKGLHEVRRWTELRSNLSESQEVCKKEWPIHVAQVLDEKPTLLMDELLTQHDFPDRHLVKHMTQGFRLTGWVCRSGLFPFDPKPPASTLQSQLSMAKSRNTATLTKLSKQAPDEVSRRAWAETLEEVDKGWIEEDENPDLSTVLVAKRFGLLQGPKVRVIDDCRACAYNLLAGIPEKYRLQSVEYIAAFLLRAMLDPRSKGVSISGKTLDLTAAYKQYATHPFDRDLLRIGVKDTSSGHVRTFKVNSLPFGATGSVSSFLRCAAAIWFLGSHALGIPWTNYFDDFPIFSKDSDCGLVEEVATSFLDLLHVYFARAGKKATVFTKAFKALGLIIDLSHFGEGYVTIGHTQERGDELRATITRILESNRLSHAEAESLRGRLHWYTSFLFGRRSSQALNVLSDWVNRSASKGALPTELRESLTFLRDVALHSEPLKISRSLQRTFLIFTDGSLEGNFACVGGILHDSQGVPLAFFSVKLNQASTERLHNHSSHPIYEIELLAVWTALTLWERHIHDSYSVFYLDNEAARGALTSARSSTLTGMKIVESFLRLEDRSLCRPWFGRVPTHSNCADDPSRDSFQHLIRQGVRRDSLLCDWPF
ncbi:unnamed protein product [Symbiodinium sp. CCMP2592]|nr:unnamed protein product [Symbiodinium sp. CCMP2592]